MTTHDDLRELLGAYALDAVDAAEAEELERHLEMCPRCRAELSALREVAGLLGYSGASAPAGVWDRIVGATQAAPPAPRPLTTLPFRLRPGTGARRGLAAAVVALAALIAVAVLAWQVGRLNHRVDVMSASAPSMSNVTAALGEPGARRVVLETPSSGRAELDAVLLPGGAGYVYGASLPPLAADQTYQLWGVTSDQVVSYGLLGASPSVVPFRAGPGVAELAVTVEEAGGVLHSNHSPVVVGKVTPAAS
jgi:anti-sigma factor RsiW